MAEEEGKEAKEGGGGGGLLKIILPVVALLLGAGGGYMMGNSSASKQVEEVKALQPEPKAGDVAKDTNAMVGDMYKLEPFVVNLNEPKGSRYLKTTIQLEMSSPELKSELDRRSAQMQDVILALLTSKSFTGKSSHALPWIAGACAKFWRISPNGAAHPPAWQWES